jgi:hypothetical protein
MVDQLNKVSHIYSFPYAWFQVSGVSIKVSGVRFQVSGEIQPEGTIHFLRHRLPFPQLTASGVLAPGLSVPMFSLIHSTTDIDV